MGENHCSLGSVWGRDGFKIYAAAVKGNKRLNAADFGELWSEGAFSLMFSTDPGELAQKSLFHMFPKNEMGEAPL